MSRVEARAAQPAVDPASNGHSAVSRRVNSGEMQEVRLLAEAYREEGMTEYNGLIIGEDHAKIMYLTLLAMGGENGMAGLTLGVPGVGKSRFLKHGHEIVEGIGREHVAKVPHREDLTPAKLTGDVSDMERSGTDKEGNDFSETFSAKVIPILRPGIKVVGYDELTRTGPLALNSSLEITQDGKIEVVTPEGRTEISEFDLVISSMNNHGTLYTHNLDPAVISRHAMGAFMGSRERGKLDDASAGIIDDPYKTYSGSEIEPVITLDELHKIREAIDHVEIQPAERELAKRLLVGMLDALHDHDLELGGPRTAAQLLRISRTLSLLYGRPKVTEQDLYNAVGYGMTSRLGAVTSKNESEVNTVVKEVLNDAAKA